MDAAERVRNGSSKVKRVNGLCCNLLIASAESEELVRGVERDEMEHGRRPMPVGSPEPRER